MKLTVLLDNNTLIDRYFQGEPGVSYLLEVDGRKTLFDVGYSATFLSNAQKLNLDLLEVDHVVLSHGHLDHTWGLFPLIQLFTEARIEKKMVKKPKLIAVPGVFSSRRSHDLPEIGSLLTPEKLSSHFEMQLTLGPLWLTDHLLFLGQIERKNDFEAPMPLGHVLENGEEISDRLLDDSALVYRAPGGLVIITGCSHSGICNIVDQACRVTGESRVLDIIGGFHLMAPPKRQLLGTINYLKEVNPGVVHACHCTDLKSKIELSRQINIEEVGVGLTLLF